MTEECADDCGNCGVKFERHPNQPYGVEIHSADGIFLKEMHIPKAGTTIPQHAHKFDHLSMLAVGSVRAWAGDKLLGDFTAPHGFNIAKGVKHKFLSLQDDTVIYCVHSLHGQAEVQIAEEHHLVLS